MAKVDFNNVPTQSTAYNTSNTNGQKLLPDGMYSAIITRCEPVNKGKGIAIELDIGIVINPKVGISHKVKDSILIGYANPNTRGRAKDTCAMLMSVLNIPNIFDDEIGVMEDDSKHLLWKKIVVEVGRGDYDFGGKKIPKNKIISYLPLQNAPAKPVEERVEYVQKVEPPKPQYSHTPINNPEAEYAAAFGGDDNIPF